MRTNDTTYFAGGKVSTGYSLRVIWIDSLYINGSDSGFVFYKAIRDTSYTNCIDSVAATWLGRRFVRLQDGTEYYFNNYGDTITLQTKASAGTTWVIGKDHTGPVTYVATMGQPAAGIIDGVTDSVKTITIQAFNNSTPVSSWYNNKHLTLSKAHGWVDALDFYFFPNNQGQTTIHGAAVDSAQHHRIDHSVKSINLRDRNPFARYTPGNDWIERKEWFHSISSPMSIDAGTSYRHDSVISSQLVNPTTLIATVFTDSVASVQTGPNTWNVFDTSFTTTITLTLPQSLPLSDTVLPEYNWRLQYINMPNREYYVRTYSIDTACADGRYVISSKIPGTYASGYTSNNGCIYLPNQGLTYPVTRNWSYLVDFGYSDEYYYWPTGLDIHQVHSTFPYININGCTLGNKIDVTKVGIDDLVKQQQGIIYPNPAKEYIKVRSVQNGNAAQTIVISDVTGRAVLKQYIRGDSDVYVGALVPGTYVVHITAGQQQFVQRLLIIR